MKLADDDTWTEKLATIFKKSVAQVVATAEGARTKLGIPSVDDAVSAVVPDQIETGLNVATDKDFWVRAGVTVLGVGMVLTAVFAMFGQNILTSTLSTARKVVKI